MPEAQDEPRASGGTGCPHLNLTHKLLRLRTQLSSQPGQSEALEGVIREINESLEGLGLRVVREKIAPLPNPQLLWARAGGPSAIIPCRLGQRRPGRVSLDNRGR